MTDFGKKLDPDLLEYLNSLNKTVGYLTKQVKFLLALEEKSLHILIRQAFLLERIANVVYELEEGESEKLSGDEVEAKFEEIRELFDQQQNLMQGRSDDDGPK